VNTIKGAILFRADSSHKVAVYRYIGKKSKEFKDEKWILGRKPRELSRGPALRPGKKIKNFKERRRKGMDSRFLRQAQDRFAGMTY